MVGAAQLTDDAGAVVEHQHVAVPFQQLGKLAAPEGVGIDLAELGIDMHLAAFVVGNVLHGIADRPGGIDMAVDPVMTQTRHEVGLAILEGHLRRVVLVGDLHDRIGRGVCVVTREALAITVHHHVSLSVLTLSNPARSARLQAQGMPRI